MYVQGREISKYGIVSFGRSVEEPGLSYLAGRPLEAQVAFANDWVARYVRLIG
jgi:hypothetical protein